MNRKIARNFSLMALMVGAMFVLNSKKAQAQSSQCIQCYETYGQCEQGCGSEGGPGCFSQCSIDLNACAQTNGCYY